MKTQGAATVFVDVSLKRRGAIVLAALAALIAFGAAASWAPAFAQQPGAVEVSAAIGGRDTDQSSSMNPIRLDPAERPEVALSIVNNTSEPVTVTSVEITGTVVGLTFFAFNSSVNLTVTPGETAALRYPLDLAGLAGQATGLIHGNVAVRSDDRTLATLPMVTDVRGSIVSVYGLFGLALVILTVLAVLDTALEIARHRMPANRWRRGMRGLTPGIGIGLILVFTLSATRVWLASPDRWLLISLAFAAIFFVIGYVSPTPESELEEDEDVVDEDFDLDDDSLDEDSLAEATDEDDDETARIDTAGTRSRFARFNRSGGKSAARSVSGSS
jgi:hypothetical protein